VSGIPLARAPRAALSQLRGYERVFHRGTKAPQKVFGEVAVEELCAVGILKCPAVSYAGGVCVVPVEYVHGIPRTADLA
jgi:hypothetical protein